MLTHPNHGTLQKLLCLPWRCASLRQHFKGMMQSGALAPGDATERPGSPQNLSGSPPGCPNVIGYLGAMEGCRRVLHTGWGPLTQAGGDSCEGNRAGRDVYPCLGFAQTIKHLNIPVLQNEAGLKCLHGFTPTPRLHTAPPRHQLYFSGDRATPCKILRGSQILPELSCVLHINSTGQLL